MNNYLIAFGVGLLGAFGILLWSRNNSTENAQIVDLTAKIKENQDKEKEAARTAADAVKEYQDALKQYDPNFYNDDGDGKPSA